MRQIFRLLPALALVLGLSACGVGTVRNTVSGAVIGGATGFALTGEPVSGAIVGGVAGVACSVVIPCPGL